MLTEIVEACSSKFNLKQVDDWRLFDSIGGGLCGFMAFGIALDVEPLINRK
jgi:hypothetical protein